MFVEGSGLFLIMNNETLRKVFLHLWSQSFFDTILFRVRTRCGQRRFAWPFI